MDDPIKALMNQLNPGIDAQAFLSRWVQQYVTLVTAIIDRKMQWANLDTLIRSGLDTVLSEPEFDRVGLSQDDKDRLMRAWYEPEPWPDTREGLERLKKKGYILATMSNASNRMQEKIAEKYPQTIGFSFPINNRRAENQ